ncbi:hypothetical protein [Agrococcus casei]|uniref:Uncharacterized protein n=1 Tax=Agrococcus casei LMG 22410 TaxID=1255656 RepID=A0A1R4FWB9_9MICO|nr:hypothetical protein [Agrococcus casei]SJM60219.1 hypothetical protein CZ674_07045 [Agrococcus casei LMG 22410]
MRAVLDAPDLYGPFAYWPWWAVGALILAVLVVLYAGLWIFGRPRGILEPPPPPPKQVDVRTVKQKYIDMIGEVSVEHQGGEMTPRELSQRLSLVLRFFAHEASGVEAEVMTLEDLRDAQVPLIPHAVEQYYPSSFMRQAKQDPDMAIETARRVVSTWA